MNYDARNSMTCPLVGWAAVLLCLTLSSTAAARKASVEPIPVSGKLLVSHPFVDYQLIFGNIVPNGF